MSKWAISLGHVHVERRAIKWHVGEHGAIFSEMEELDREEAVNRKRNGYCLIPGVGLHDEATDNSDVYQRLRVASLECDLLRGYGEYSRRRRKLKAVESIEAWRFPTTSHNGREQLSNAESSFDPR